MIRASAHQLILILALTLAGCTGMKDISSQDPLYLGHEIKFTVRGAEKKKLTSVINDVLTPEPNNKFLWMRPALARYNMISDTARRKKFWKNKISAPVLLSQTRQDRVFAAIENRMFHNGYFKNKISLDTFKVGQRKAKYRYTITLNEPYRFQSISFPEPNNELTQTIRGVQVGSLLKTGNTYTLESVKNERIRIDRYLKERGYFYFNPEFIL